MDETTALEKLNEEKRILYKNLIGRSLRLIELLNALMPAIDDVKYPFPEEIADVVYTACSELVTDIAETAEILNEDAIYEAYM